MPDLLDAEAIKSALRALSDELHAQQQSGELLLVGGAAMALVYDARPTTKDVDVYIVSPERAAILREAASRVAAKLDLPEDWLNDGAKGYMHPAQPSIGVTVFEGEALVVRALAPEQLLAMKLVAWRGDVDITDAGVLLAQLSGSKEEIWSKVEVHVVPGQENKACYAFEDLWEKHHDSAS